MESYDVSFMNTDDIKREKRKSRSIISEIITLVGKGFFSPSTNLPIVLSEMT